MNLMPVGRFGPGCHEKLGTVSRMLPDVASVGFYRGTCRKDSSGGTGGRTEQQPQQNEIGAPRNRLLTRQYDVDHGNEDDGGQREMMMEGEEEEDRQVEPEHHDPEVANGDDGDDEIDLSRFASEKDTRAYFKRKLAIFEASMMTPATANRRLAARKIAMEARNYGGMYDSAIEMEDGDRDELDCIPPKQLLMYLVRMGSFTSAPQIKNVDYQDDKLEITDGMSMADLLEYCRIARGEDRPPLVKRKFLKPVEQLNTGSDLTDGFKMLKLDAISKSKGGDAAGGAIFVK
uniref:Uncharacterized protein n=1 Tax=Anopheles triannulatus TaxID=58253 RepID=A0A2M4AKM1_9DIPT